MMYVILQLVAILCSILCIGSATSPRAAKFDKVSFSILSLTFLIFVFVVEMVKV